MSSDRENVHWQLQCRIEPFAATAEAPLAQRERYKLVKKRGTWHISGQLQVTTYESEYRTSCIRLTPPTDSRRLFFARDRPVYVEM